MPQNLKMRIHAHFDDFKKIADSCPSDAHLTSIDAKANEYNTAKYILMNDIVCPSDYDSAGAFYGVLDGNGYTMKNLSKPLFITIASATVKNLGLEINYTIDSDLNEFYYGAIAQSVNVWNNANGVYIDNCFVKGNVDITCRTGWFGGFIGKGKKLKISNSYNESDIYATTILDCYMGGLSGDGALIENCFNNGNLTALTTCDHAWSPTGVYVRVGGLQGNQSGDKIIDSYNSGDISVETPVGCRVYTGGILGYNYTGGRVENCYNVGYVTQDWTWEYDLTDDSYGSTFSPSYYAGGIIGYSGQSITVTRCWNGGNVVGEHFVGGIAGALISKDTEAITDCYNSAQISAVINAGGILGKEFGLVRIARCYNSGEVVNATNCGAIAGSLQNSDSSIQSCYYIDNGLSATGIGVTMSGATMVTEAQMKVRDTFEDFDFFNIWRLKADDPSPTLQ